MVVVVVVYIVYIKISAYVPNGTKGRLRRLASTDLY